MKQNYDFKIGDRVITIEGETGVIVDICKCEACERRGFYEPIWRSDYNGDMNYITGYSSDFDYSDYYQIGEYRFGEFDRVSVIQNAAYHKSQIEQLRKQLALMDAIEGVESYCLHIKNDASVDARDENESVDN